jgi:hypothetical protein
MMMDSESKDGRQPEQHAVPPSSDTEDFGNMNQDDSLFFHDDEQEDEHVKRHSINLEISRDESTQPHQAMVGFGDEGSTSTASIAAQQDKEQPPAPPKRKESKAPTRRKRKRRKVLQDEETIELSSEHIKHMIADTSDIVLPIQHPADSTSSRSMTAKITDHNVLLEYLDLEELIARPTLADDGCMAKELLQFWDRTTRVVFGKPMGYDVDSTKKISLEDQKDEEEDSDVELTRRSQEEKDDEEEQSSFPPAPEDQDMFPDNNNDIFFAEEPEETHVPALDQENEETAPPLMDSTYGTGCVIISILIALLTHTLSLLHLEMKVLLLQVRSVKVNVHWIPSFPLVPPMTCMMTA